jgi:hypothetical protein
MEEMGSAVMNSMLVVYRRLKLPDDFKEEQWLGATVTKIRFTEEARFRRELPLHRVDVRLWRKTR